MIMWGDDIILPAQIWCFVDLRNLDEDCVTYEPGVYAIVESADENPNQNEKGLSELFVPYIKETNGFENGKVKRKFYIVDVESIHSEACVIPDMGNANPAAFLRLLPKDEWSKQFVRWLREEHTRNFT